MLPLLLAALAGASPRPDGGVSVPASPLSAPALPSLDGGTASLDAGTVAYLVGAGDIVRCDKDIDEATSRLLDTLPGTVFTLGDNAYLRGTAQEFSECFHPSWGRHLPRIRPAPGNHDYYTPRAAGYFGYFGAAAGPAPQGYYSYRAGEWRVLVLNSVCDEVPGGCGRDSPQGKWLAQQLTSQPTRCTLAMWHHPRFSSGRHGNDEDLKPFFDLLYEHGAELVLNGHDHNYERLAPANPSGAADPKRGLREFVVGTGGVSLRPFWANPLPITERRDSTTHGVLALTLRPDGYDWKFVPVPGGTFTDSGSGTCH